MTNPYELLLSPFKLGTVTLKNRMMGSKCALQSFTLEQAREFYADMAKNGAATAECPIWTAPATICGTPLWWKATEKSPRQSTNMAPLPLPR